MYPWSIIELEPGQEALLLSEIEKFRQRQALRDKYAHSYTIHASLINVLKGMPSEYDTTSIFYCCREVEAQRQRRRREQIKELIARQAREAQEAAAREAREAADRARAEADKERQQVRYLLPTKCIVASVRSRHVR
jgi:hypothetical protein